MLEAAAIAVVAIVVVELELFSFLISSDMGYARIFVLCIRINEQAETTIRQCDSIYVFVIQFFFLMFVLLNNFNGLIKTALF